MTAVSGMGRGRPRAGGDLVPVLGGPVAVRFDGRVVHLWWGQDRDGHDRLAARGPRLYAFASLADCLAAARANGWPPDEDPEDGVRNPGDVVRNPGDLGDVDSPVVVDLTPAQDWLRHRRAALDVGSALNLWNWATDAAHSTGQPWHDRGALRDCCYQKLFAATVPWVFGRESYGPVWSPRQVRALRAMLDRAVHVLRTAVGS